MLYHKIDTKTGMFICDVITDNPTVDLISAHCPDGFYLPKWDGKTWVEGLSPSEIDAIKASAVPSEPSIDERMVSVETDVDEIVIALATMEGVTA